MSRLVIAVWKAFWLPFCLMLRLLSFPARWAKPAKIDSQASVMRADQGVVLPEQTQRRKRRFLPARLAVKSGRVLILVALALVAASMGYAYFTTNGAGTGTLNAGSLASPGPVTATSAGLVSWSAVPAPSGPDSEVSYTVQRNGGAASDTCAGSLSQSTTSCTDAPSASGTYTYTVTATFRSWTSSAVSAPVLVDTTPPTSAITFPVVASYDNAGWNGSSCGGGTGNICGTAHDDTGGSGVSSVAVSILGPNGTWWDGSSFAATSEHTILASGTVGWTLSFPSSNFATNGGGDGSYTVTSYATDNAGNSQASGSSVTFTIDNVTPVTSIRISPAAPTGSNGWYTVSIPTFTLDASDSGGPGVATTFYQIDGGTTHTYTGSAVEIPDGPAETVSYWSVDTTGNTETTHDYGPLKVDTTPPTGGSLTANGSPSSSYNTTGTVALAFASFTDDGSGISSNQISRASGTLIDNVCGPISGAAGVIVSGPNDSASLTTGCYQYTLTGTNNGGNTAVATSAIIKVDTSPPSTPTSATITPVAGAANQFVSGSQVFYNPAQAGSFTVESSTSDDDTGISRVAFPSVTGFAGGGDVTSPQSGTTFRTTYSWSNNDASASPGAQSIASTNNAAATATNNTAFTVTKDGTAPTGGAISVPVYVNAATGSTAITTTSFSDADSGIASNVITRSDGQAPSGGVCPSSGYSGASTVTSPDATVANGLCYVYTLTGTDHVGNAASVTSGAVLVDTVAPSATFVAPTARVYNNASWNAGNVCGGGAFCGSSHDDTAGSGVQSVTLSILGPNGGYWNGSDFTGLEQTVTMPTSTNWIFEFHQFATTGGGDGSYTVTSYATDNAGNTQSPGTSVTFTIDNTPPAVSMTQVNGTAHSFPVVTNGTVTSIGGTCGTASGDLTSVSWAILPRSGTATCTAGTWTSGLFTAISNPGTYVATASQSDQAGNTGSQSEAVDIIDNTPPTAAITFPTAPIYDTLGWGGASGAITGTADDHGGSGVATVNVSVKDVTSGKCADATGAFTVPSCTTNFVATTGSPTSWSFAESAANLTHGDSYTVTVETTDFSGNTDALSATASWAL